MSRQVESSRHSTYGSVRQQRRRFRRGRDLRQLSKTPALNRFPSARIVFGNHYDRICCVLFTFESVFHPGTGSSKAFSSGGSFRYAEGKPEHCSVSRGVTSWQAPNCLNLRGQIEITVLSDSGPARSWIIGACRKVNVPKNGQVIWLPLVITGYLHEDWSLGSPRSPRESAFLRETTPNPIGVISKYKPCYATEILAMFLELQEAYFDQFRGCDCAASCRLPRS